VNDKQSDALERVMDLVRFLRAHCPWDAAQTHRSLIPYLLEEAHETADAITDADDDALRSELGDLLLNVAFQLVLGEERAAFDAAAVADTVVEKMRRRHPHLYGLGEKEDWETLKAKERDAQADDSPGSLLEGVARGLDPLSRAHRIQDRVAAVGFDWEDATGAFAKVAEELEEVREHLERTGHPDAAPALEEELGDLLFAVVNLSRLAGAHSLNALHAANAKFTRRFQALERLAADRDMDLQEATLEEMEALWTTVKASE
jgi:MazG family protein